MFDHLSLPVTDIPRARRFYDAVLGALAIPRVWAEDRALGYGSRDTGAAYLTLRLAAAASPPAAHTAFRASSRDAVRAFHAAGLAQGGTCDGPPGPRPHYGPTYYAAFLLDPDGNRIEAVHRDAHRAGPG